MTTVKKPARVRRRRVKATVQRGWMPTRKWWAATVTAIVGWAVLFVQQNYEFTTALVIALVTLVGQRAIAYLLPNEAAPGGVPDAEVKLEPAHVESGGSHTRST